MNKNKALVMLLAARQAHLGWRFHAEKLIQGIELDESAAPVDAGSCEFGRWYEVAGKDCLGFLQHYRLVAESHRVMHAMYGEIYERVRYGDLDQARAKLPDLIKASDALLGAIDLLEREVSEAPGCPD